VAEAIVAAQDAGLVETSIDPPPVLDILVTGRALDKLQVKKALEQKDLEVGVSPEVFGAWFTDYGRVPDVVAMKNIRIMQPSRGLKTLYDQRAAVLNSHIEAVRKAKGGAPAPKAEPAKTKEETKPAETKESKPAESKDEAKAKDESKKDESKKDESKKDEPK
jgi:hypothetical protein